MFISLWGTSPRQFENNEELPPIRKRRGVTSLEYLAVISLILIALILAVQHLGFVTGGLFTNNAKATSATIQSGP
jgi:hypothetical protein